VRTAFEGWHVPSGYRVVWSDRPPADRPDVALIPEKSLPPAAAPIAHEPPEPGPAADPAPVVGDPAPAPAPEPVEVPAAPCSASELPEQASGAEEPVAMDDPVPAETPAPAASVEEGRLPIQDVLAHLNAEDGAEQAAATPPAPAEAQAPRRRAPSWDFMDDDPIQEAIPPGLAPRRAPQGGAGAGAALTADAGMEADSPERGPGRFSEGWGKIRSAVRNFVSGPAEPKPLLVIGLALVLAIGVAAALAFYSTSAPPGPPTPSDLASGAGEGGETAETPDPFAASAPDISAPEPEMAAPPEGVDEPAAGERAYVAASVLSCRAAPVLQALRVRNLARGQQVRVLARDGDWASIERRGGQCWVRAHYLSPVPPL
jgi:hypothetical protein